MAFTAYQFLEIIERNLPDDDAEAAQIIADLQDYLEEKYDELTNKRP